MRATHGGLAAVVRAAREQEHAVAGRVGLLRRAVAQRRQQRGRQRRQGRLQRVAARDRAPLLL